MTQQPNSECTGSCLGGQHVETVTAIPIGLYDTGTMQQVSRNPGGTQTVGIATINASLLLQITNPPSSGNPTYTLTYSDTSAVQTSAPAATVSAGGTIQVATIPLSATPPSFSILTIKAVAGSTVVCVSVQVTA